MTPERYPRARILEQSGHWDEATRDVVMDRVHNTPTVHHFSGEALRTLEALCECIVPQADRSPARRVPIVPWIDERIASGAPEGFRFEDMPPLAAAWQRGLEGLNQTALERFGRSFSELETTEQRAVLEAVRTGTATGDAWRTMPAQRWWIYVALREIIGIYYAHPLAWDEIGFGGPAFPRGYAALNHGAREPWETAEDTDAVAADLAVSHVADEAAGETTMGSAGATRAPAHSAHRHSAREHSAPSSQAVEPR